MILDKKKQLNHQDINFGDYISNHCLDRIVVISATYELNYFNISAENNPAFYGLEKLELGKKIRPLEFDFWTKKIKESLTGKTLRFKKSYTIHNKAHSDLIHIYPVKNKENEIIAIALHAKNIDDQLTENERNTQSILNNINDKMFAIDTDYKLISFNKAVAEFLPAFFGKEKLEMGIEMLPNNPSNRKIWLDHYSQVFEGQTIHVEKEYTINDVSKIDLVTLSPISNKNGKVTGAVIYGKEFTDIQNVKKAYQNSLIQLKDAQQLGKIGTWSYDMDSQKLNWSRSALELLDYTASDSPPSNLQECINLIHPKDLTRATEAIYAAIKKGNPLEEQARMVTKKGRIIYAQGKGKAVFDEDNNFVSLEGTIQDITQLKEFEENIQHTNQKYKDLFENVYDAIVITDENAKMIDSNPAAQQLMGYTKKELQQLSLKDVVHPEDLSYSLAYLEKLHTDGYYSNYQGRVITKSGAVKYVQVNSSAIYEDGKMIGSRDIVRDITHLKANEKKREQLLLELAEVNKELKDFAHIVSHDLKAPLRAINSIVTWLSEDYGQNLDKKGNEQLALLFSQIRRMHKFINGIFKYTKLARIKETKEIVNIENLIQHISIMLNLEKNAELNILNSLPEIYCEKIKIHQVFQNLISNAVKYNDKKICKIEIDYEELDTHHLFSIKDYGKGMEEKNFKKIFQIFQTAESKDIFESTGIGLSIVRKIIQLHGGKITIESKIGKYTIFKFTLKK